MSDATEKMEITSSDIGPIDPAIGDSQQLAPVPSISKMLESGQANVHNFVGDRESTYKFVATACGPDTIRSKESIDKVIDIKYYLAHLVEMVDRKAGEYQDQTRIVIVSKDGKYYSFVSGGIVSAIDLIRSTFGDVPWETELRHRVVEHQTRSGQTMLSLVPA